MARWLVGFSAWWPILQQPITSIPAEDTERQAGQGDGGSSITVVVVVAVVVSSRLGCSMQASSLGSRRVEVVVVAVLYRRTSS